MIQEWFSNITSLANDELLYVQFSSRKMLHIFKMGKKNMIELNFSVKMRSLVHCFNALMKDLKKKIYK